MSNRESQTGKFFMGTSGLSMPENLLEREFEKVRLEKDAEEANKLFLELEQQKQKELDEKLERLEFIPLMNKVVLLPYPRNPYRKILKGGIIVDYTGDFNNPDSGEKDNLKELIGCAKIIEVGPQCQYLKPGDDVFYDTRTCYPFPFLSMGYLLTAEPQILCALNEGLKARFKME